MSDDNGDFPDNLSPEPLSAYLENDGSEKQLNLEPPSEPVTNKEAFSKAQLEQQKAEREEPESTYILTPTGPEPNDVKKGLAEQREAQITYRESVLEGLRNKPRDDFNMTQQDYDIRQIERDDRDT